MNMSKAKINIDYYFLGKKKDFTKLAEHPAIEEIENIGMDEGRFFVHLRPYYRWNPIEENMRTQSFGSIGEARAELKRIIKIEQENE